MIVSFGAFAADAARQPVQEAGGQYKVRSGETLNQIAARIRPNNMSLAQTMQTIVQANPNVFKHGNHNLIYAGDVLRIPSSMQLKGGSAQTAPAKVTQETAADKADNAVPAFGPKIVTGTEASPAAATGGKQAAVEEKKVEAQPASAAVVESTKKTEPAEEKKEAVPAASSAPAEKSVAPAADAVKSSAPQEAATASAQEEQKGSTWPWILFGGAGLAALLFLSKKRSAAAGKQEEEAVSSAVSSKKQGTDVSSVSKAAATTAAVGTAAAAASAVHAAEDDEVAVEDDIFFSDVKHEFVEGTGSDIDIDLDSIDGQQGIVTSMVTNDEESQKLADVDWDKIESTESVFEDDIPPAASPVAATYTAATEQVEEPQEVASRQVAEEPLDFDEQAVADKAVETIDFEPSVEEVSLAASEPVVAEVQPVVEEVAVVEPVVSGAVEWAGSGVSDATQQESLLSSAEDTLEFVKADIEPEAGVQTVAQPLEQSIDLGGVSSSEGLDFVSDSKEETLASTEGFAEDASAAHIKEASEDEVIAWDSVDFSGDEEIGFVSESVGMTAPLEAKFELAEMYIEIGDPDAARETLNELIDEAKGDILTKSKALLAEIS